MTEELSMAEKAKEDFILAIVHLRHAEDILERLTFFSAANKVSTIADYLKLDPLYRWQEERSEEPRPVDRKSA